MATRNYFDSELTNLKHALIRMADATQEAITKTTKALVSKDFEAAQKVIQDDDLIDEMEEEIENICIDLIVQQQPVAGDMRLIFAVNKIAADLERIADYAHSIAKLNIKMKDEVYMKRFVNIERMSEIAVQMIRDSIKAFLEKDCGLAKKVYNMDDELDDLYHEVFTELMSYVIADPKNINQAMNLLLIARYYERTGDHVQNICEWLFYRLEGKRVELD
jgi:phosphate transport system protein